MHTYYLSLLIKDAVLSIFNLARILYTTVTSELCRLSADTKYETGSIHHAMTALSVVKVFNLRAY